MINNLVSNIFRNSSENQPLNLINDILLQKYIQRINISCYKRLFDSDFIFYGKVEFKNNGTSLEQEFEGDSLLDVFVKIQKFCINLP